MQEQTPSASLFSAVLGISGLGYAWRNAALLWPVPPQIGDAILLCAALTWAGLLIVYALHCVRRPGHVRSEFSDGIQGSMPALLSISTLVLVPAALTCSRPLAWTMALAGIACNLLFACWHGGRLWRGARDTGDTTPALYLPAVAGNFTSGAALALLGQGEWGYLFIGAGLFSWLALEPLIAHSVWHRAALAPARRALLGIQAAPPVVCAAALLAFAPDAVATRAPWLLMLWGYGLFQLAQGLRLASWLGESPFSRGHWAYTFGMTSALNCALKFARAGIAPARALAMPMLAAVTLFIACLLLHSARAVWLAWRAAATTATTAPERRTPPSRFINVD